MAQLRQESQFLMEIVMFANILLVVLALQNSLPVSATEPLGEIIAGSKDVQYCESTDNSTITVTSEDGTRFVYDLKQRRQYVVFPDGTTSEREL